MKHQLNLISTGLALAISSCIGIGLVACGGNSGPTSVPSSTSTPQNALATATPIKHVVVIYNENVSFDHYFATYPAATNPSGEPAFNAISSTPTVNGLSGALLTANGNNTNTTNGSGASNPFRLDRSQNVSADQNHAYTAEQQANHDGFADLYPLYTGKGTTGGVGAFGTTGQVMGYYDGNTVTALWNYAQRYAMSDNAYTDTYGPSTPGALAAVSGQTNGMQIVANTGSIQPSTVAAPSYYINDGQGGLTMMGDVDPAYDVCSSTSKTALMTGKNIGDLLNTQKITWGGFMAGFNLGTTNANSTTGCARTSTGFAATNFVDYIPHHNWFQYYQSTSNPTHARPSSIAAIGSSTQTDGVTAELANHEYDVNDFYTAVQAGNFPSVSYLKAPSIQDGHPGYSDPLDEQAFVTQVVNFLQQQPDWANTVVIVAYDDSDGWYDHAYAYPTSSSFDSQADQLNAPGQCGVGGQPVGLSGAPVNGRCGPGVRTPFIVISPWANSNYVSHTRISQASIVRFIEDNWLGGARIGAGSFDSTAGSIMDMFNFTSSPKATPLYIDPIQGTLLSVAPAGSAAPIAP